MTPENLLGTDHLIFCVCVGGAGGVAVLFLKIFFDRKTEIFFLTVREPKYFFQDKAKNICSNCILLDLYVRVFLEPNIHGYIVYMFVYTCILDIWARVYMSHDMTKPTKWLCPQRRLRSAWASAQFDQGLRCPHEESLGP